MEIISHGNMDAFKRRFSFINKGDSHFFVKTSGMSKKIQYTDDKKGMLFIDNDFKLKGVFLCNMVRSDIKKYIASGNSIPELTEGNSSVVCFNDELIKKSVGKELSCIDINYCYWQTAYNLGFITEKTFTRGIISKDLKDARNIAIGSLNKTELIEEYLNGKIISKKIDDAQSKIFSPFYRSVITVVNKIMVDAMLEFSDSILMWLTDCAFMLPEREKQFKRFLQKKKYKYKTFYSIVKSMDEKKCIVSWESAKDHNEPKSMSYDGRILNLNK